MITFRYEKLAERKLKKAMFTSSDLMVKAAGMAINDTTKSMRSKASMEIRKHLNLTKASVDKRIQRFFINRMHGGIRIRTQRPISLSNLTRPGAAKQRKTGVSYKLYKDRTTFVRSGFGPKIAKLSGSVYVRAGKERKPLSIKQYKDLAQDVYAQGVVHNVKRQASEIMRKRLKANMRAVRLGKIK